MEEELLIFNKIYLCAAIILQASVIASEILKLADFRTEFGEQTRRLTSLSALQISS